MIATEVFHVLHLGCGRKGRTTGLNMPTAKVTSLDADPLLEPDLVCVLGRDPIPLPDDSVDFALAVHVLEHIGIQGETERWFYFWEELYRVLKPGGSLQFESPLYNSVWAWADPQHCRALSPQALIYFDQDSYRLPGSAITPYRIKADFELGAFRGVVDGNPQVAEIEQFSHFAGTLVARKPFKGWWD